MAQWQDIETAPRDMTEIVGLDEKGNAHITWYFAPSSQTFGWARLKKSGATYWKPKWWSPLPQDHPIALRRTT
jgi:hypothetical protein